MKIMLIRPDLPEGMNIVLECAPPLGLMYVASYLLKARPADEVRIVDCVLDELDPAKVGETVESFRPRLVGISAMSIHAPVLHQIAAQIKEKLPDTVVVVGGPHAAAAHDRILSDPNVDVVIPGEGEAIFLELVDALDNNRRLNKVPGMVIRDGDDGATVTHTGQREPIADLDSIPFPAWDLASIQRFFDYRVKNQNNLRARQRYTTIFTSRACPYRCIYCHNIFGKRFRARSISNVLDEMSILHDRYGVREFHILDDCFNLDLDRAREVMRSIIKRGWDIRMAFPNGMRADRLPDDFLQIMRRAGVYKMNFGIESGTKRIQAIMRKNLDLNLVKNAIDRADRTGFITHGFFMIGFPTETSEEMLKTIEYACTSRLLMAGFFFVNPYPNTPLYNLAISHGWAPPEIIGDEGCYHDVGVNVSAVPSEELNRIQMNAYRRFYLNPVRASRLAWRLPRKMDLWDMFRAHWKVKFI